MKEMLFEIKEHYGVLGNSSTGMTKEVNLVAWNEGIAKVDIRKWSQDHVHMSRGVTLKQEEVKRLYQLLELSLEQIDEITTSPSKSMETEIGKGREIVFEIVKYIGNIATYSTGWSKELNFVKWNEEPPAMDIRDWSIDHNHMSGGISLNKEESFALYQILKNICAKMF